MSNRISAEFRSLCQRLEEIRRHFLPIHFSVSGSYSPAEYDRVRGYVALTHAEIEAYIEERCLTVADHCVKKWQTTKTPSAVIIALHAICYSGWAELLDAPKFKKASPTPQMSVEARLSDALSQYRQCVEDNHGIKADNIKRLVVPLSVRMSELDQTWLADMDSYGTTRGKIVHLSFSTVHQPDPKDYRNTIWKRLVPGLRELDALFNNLII